MIQEIFVIFINFHFVGPAKLNMIKFNSLMIIMKDLNKSIKFFNEGLGYKINIMNENFAELENNNLKISFNKVENESYTIKGFTTNKLTRIYSFFVSQCKKFRRSCI
jgi:hypothetical protein